MNAEIMTDTTGKAPRNGLRWRQILLIVTITILLTAGITTWLVSQYLFRKSFTPVQLRPKEEQVLSSKLRAIGLDMQEAKTGAPRLEPERYSEVGAKREISFTEREVNAFLAKNTDLAQKLAIDLSADMISAKLLVPLDPDFLMLGGKTLRVSAGAELAYKDGAPIVVLKGVSVMGVPITQRLAGQSEEYRPRPEVRRRQGLLEKLR